MKALAIAVATITLAAALPAWSQTTSPQNQPSTERAAPGTGGISKPGEPGKPGSKSGKTVSPSSGTSTPSNGTMRKSGDESKVPGKTGSKSGPAAHPGGENGTSQQSK